MPPTSTAKVVIHTTPTCPDCRAPRDWLARQDIAFEERDLSNPPIAEVAKTRTGVRVASIAIVGTEIFYGAYESQKPGLIKALGLPTLGLPNSV